jgi:hypothetical protein
MGYCFYIETDNDFSLEFKGELHAGCGITLHLDDVKQLDEIKLLGPFGTPLSENSKTGEYLYGVGLIKAAPEEQLCTLGGNRGVHWIPNIPTPKWDDTRLQALRLVSEIIATQELDMEMLCESMDLEMSELNELMDRIQKEWEAQIYPKQKQEVEVFEREVWSDQYGDVVVVNANLPIEDECFVVIGFDNLEEALAEYPNAKPYLNKLYEWYSYSSE